mmetsp:Transcript_4485/g.7535  ORF Transcript_4485/g.7535 Transcript_4485/m.7535 type:complete len:91 (+) Transcript_4485:387-659(+)
MAGATQAEVEREGAAVAMGKALLAARVEAATGRADNTAAEDYSAAVAAVVEEETAVAHQVGGSLAARLAGVGVGSSSQGSRTLTPIELCM